ncbi:MULTISPECIES: DUF998 domain-containing protein [unclassified Haladaptatus]|uniref:DUF998 domain-containing protein n=1 Tax=unclassified Haladaptatus TaxID=2622732 RepID=UPI00209C13B4|nr:MULTISPECIES: DUF998 domain-containing protein [unclassified Haladaptatus]MCO8245644.1 DUF998 domain-containing protein [Haladaptatus sp. AB643]MCO8255472.1 DUF998 domain-containing protein [Haladaptatus sp. AB618]
MNRTRTIPELSGLAAPLVTFGAILLAALISPRFSWTLDALSDLGAAGESTAWLFNGGLIVGAILALPFVRGLWARRENRFDAVGTVVLLVSFVGMGLVGIFPEGTNLHFPMAITFYAGLTYALFFLGSGRIVTDERTLGLGSVWLAVIHITSWILWAVGIRIGSGLAIPETVGALILIVWMVATVRRF